MYVCRLILFTFQGDCTGRGVCFELWLVVLLAGGGEASWNFLLWRCAGKQDRLHCLLALGIPPVYVTSNGLARISFFQVPVPL